MSLRLCLVGCGAIGRIHAEILRAEGVTLQTVVGREAESTAPFATELGFQRSTTDLNEALDDACDVVVIASPNDQHYPQARQALLAGKHVLVEIPLAMSYAEGVDLVALAQQQNRLLMVAHSERFIPSLAAIQHRVATGALRIHHLIGREMCLRRVNTGWTGRQRSWTDSLLWHFGGHVVDFSLWILGADRAEIVAQVARPDIRTGVPMDIDILLRTPADQLASISLSFHSHFDAHEYLIIGEEESIQFDRGRLIGPEGLRDDTAAAGLDYYRLSWEAQDREFLAAVREGRPSSMDGAAALPALAVLQEIEDRFMGRRHGELVGIGRSDGEQGR